MERERVVVFGGEREREKELCERLGMKSGGGEEEEEGFKEECEDFRGGGEMEERGRVEVNVNGKRARLPIVSDSYGRILVISADSVKPDI